MAVLEVQNLLNIIEPGRGYNNAKLYFLIKSTTEKNPDLSDKDIKNIMAEAGEKLSQKNLNKYLGGELPAGLAVLKTLMCRFSQSEFEFEELDEYIETDELFDEIYSKVKFTKSYNTNNNIIIKDSETANLEMIKNKLETKYHLTSEITEDYLTLKDKPLKKALYAYYVEIIKMIN